MLGGGRRRSSRLPDADKLAMTAPTPTSTAATPPVGSESLTYSLGVDAPPDLFEAFNIGPDDRRRRRPGHRGRASTASSPPTSGPTGPGPAPCGTALVAYFDEVAGLAHRLTSIFAVALGCSTRTSSSTRPTTRPTPCGSIRYERQPGSPDPLPGQAADGRAHRLRHRDRALRRPRCRGSRSSGPTASGTASCPEEGAFLVNLGDLLAQWTNDRWRSTLHRVVPAAGGRRDPARAPVGGLLPRRQLRRPGRGACATCCSSRRAAPVPAGAGRRPPHGQAAQRAHRDRLRRRRDGVTDTVGDRLGGRHPRPGA